MKNPQRPAIVGLSPMTFQASDVEFMERGTFDGIPTPSSPVPPPR